MAPYLGSREREINSDAEALRQLVSQPLGLTHGIGVGPRTCLHQEARPILEWNNPAPHVAQEGRSRCARGPDGCLDRRDL